MTTTTITIFTQSPFWFQGHPCPASSEMAEMLRGGMLIFVDVLSGKTITLIVEATNTVRFIKAMHQDKEGIQSSQQRLIFWDKVLEDGRTLSHYSIQPQSHVTMHVKMQISVSLSTGKTIALDAWDSDTAYDLKVCILVKEGIPVCGQRLSFAGNPLADDITLSYYNIQKDFTLHLVQRMPILVEDLTGNYSTFVMTKIAAEEGIPPDQQRIVIMRRTPDPRGEAT